MNIIQAFTHFGSEMNERSMSEKTEAGLALVNAEGAQALILTRTAKGFEQASTADFPVLNLVSQLTIAEMENESQTAGSPLGTILAATAIVGLAMAGMAIGVIVSNRRIKGSCGDC